MPDPHRTSTTLTAPHSATTAATAPSSDSLPMQIDGPGGHYDQLLRQTRAHHVELSVMADTKANILMTVSAIVIPLMLRYITDVDLRAAAMTMIFFNIMTIVLAAYVVMPKRAIIRRSRTGHPLFNPLFFGDFATMTYGEYRTAMEKVLASPEDAYEFQVREIYALGCHLARRKYRYLQLAYIAFIFGVSSSCIILMVGYFTS